MTRSIGTGPAGGGGAGGGGTVNSVNGISPDGAGNVTLTAADVGADPAGTGATEAASAVAAHVALADPHSVYYLTDGTKTITGNVALAGTNVVGAANVSATTAMTATTFNGVALTTGGGGGLYLDDQGAYTTTGPSPLMPMQYSDAGNRGPGAALRSGGDLFGNLTPGSSIGQPTTGGTVRRVSWRRTTTPAGSIRISAINAGGGTERAFFLVAAGAGIGDGEASGLSFAVNDGEQIAVFWDSTSTGTTQDLAVTVYVEPS